MEYIPLSPSKRDFTNDIIIEDISEDMDIMNADSKSDQSVFSPPPRAKTRLLSRSLSVSDISGVNKLEVELEPPRRNSSGEYNQQLFKQSTPIVNLAKNQSNLTSLNSKINQQNGFEETISNSTISISELTPPVNQLSPINSQFQSHQSWRPTHILPPKEDTFTALLQTTAERVLNRLKSRQQDLGRNVTASKKFKKHPLGVLQPVPRKLQPIFRDADKAAAHRVDSRNTDSKSDCENVSLFNL